MNATEPLTALARATAERSAAKRAAAERAIKDLIKAGQPITVSAVARKAGVSANYLYQHRDLYERIARHREDTRGVPRAFEETESSGRIESALRVHIRQLEAEHRKSMSEMQHQLADAERRIQNLTAEVIQLRRHKNDDATG